jgi:hypothetical protein
LSFLKVLGKASCLCSVLQSSSRWFFYRWDVLPKYTTCAVQMQYDSSSTAWCSPCEHDETEVFPYLALGVWVLQWYVKLNMSFYCKWHFHLMYQIVFFFANEVGNVYWRRRVAQSRATRAGRSPKTRYPQIINFYNVVYTHPL